MVSVKREKGTGMKAFSCIEVSVPLVRLRAATILLVPTSTPRGMPRDAILRRGGGSLRAFLHLPQVIFSVVHGFQLTPGPAGRRCCD